MSLEGNLTAFGLSEILQLVAVQQKSGMLSVTSQDGSKVLFFRQGKIISTRDRRRRTRDPIKDYLTRYGILTREELNRMITISVESKLDLTDVLVSEALVTEDEMKLHFRNHVQEEVYELLTWEQCSYKFIPGNDIIEGIKTWDTYSIEGFLMESMRRIDEFPGMLKDFPDLSTVIHSARHPSEDQELTTVEQCVFDLLIEDDKTISELIASARVPQFDTYEALKHLKDKSIITVREAPQTSDADTGKSARKRRRRARPNLLPVAISLVVFCASSYWGTKSFMREIRTHTVTVTTLSGSGIERNRIDSKLRWALEAYRARHYNYPTSLAELQQNGFVDPILLERADRLYFRYRLTEGGAHYTLL